MKQHKRLKENRQKGATHSDENEQKSLTGQHETISFIARPATRK